MNYKNEVLDVLEDIGIYIEDTGETILLQDYIIDSIQFITLIVKIEEKLDFVFPDEYLLYDSISTLEMFCNIIDNAKQNL